jgi:hypothetical protein
MNFAEKKKNNPFFKKHFAEQRNQGRLRFRSKRLTPPSGIMVVVANLLKNHE